MKPAFSEKAGLHKLAHINWDLLVSMWTGLLRQKTESKFFMLIPVVFYSAIGLYLALFFFITAIFEFIPRGISFIASKLSSLTEATSKTNYGTLNIIFLPPVIFLVSILMAIAIMLPKPVVMTDNN